jgi:hypothetical protein
MAMQDQVLREDLPMRLRAEFSNESRVQSRPRPGSTSRARKTHWVDKAIDAMSNPLIVVNSALYGTPSIAAVDVTAAVQALFDLQYLNNPQLLAFTLTDISPTLFNIEDPALNYAKSLTIAYSIPGAGDGNAFARGGQDGQTLSLIVAPLYRGEVIGAFYGTGSLGIDLTAKLTSYLADPGNSRQIEIGSAAFWRTFCPGHDDPAPHITKYFSVRLRKSPDSEVINHCGYDGQTVDLTLPADPNPLIVVNSALYGAPSIAAVDVTAKIQALFDLQYQANPQLLAFTLTDISPTLFNIEDPALNYVKSLTIAYSNPAAAGNVFFRGGQDGQNLSLAVTPLNRVEVIRAFYGTDRLGIDLTTKLISYLADPGNSRQISIGSAAFFTVFCGGNDPAPSKTKYFSVTLRKSGYAINQCGYDGQTVDLTPPANQSWMSDLANSTPGFQDLKLSQICLPGTHDTGTYSLGSTFTTNDGAWIKADTDTIQTFMDKIDFIPYISKFIDPLDWVQSAILDDTRAFATSTHSDIRQQLNDGIRCLDLRVYYNHNDPVSPFYTYHGLVGVRIETILDEIAYFISDVAPDGEIVYIKMSGYWDDKTPGNGFTIDQLQQLSDLVSSYFKDEQLFGPVNAGSSDLLDCTYSQIIASSGSNRSMVILLMDDILDRPSQMVSKGWPLSGTNIVDQWADTDDVSQMIADKQSSSIQANSESRPFALSLTLTPQNDTVIKVLEGSLPDALVVLAGDILATPIETQPIHSNFKKGNIDFLADADSLLTFKAEFTFKADIN